MSAFGGKADIDEREIENLLGTDRINYLMAYSGLRRDDLLNSLSRELSIEWAQIWRLSIRLGGAPPHRITNGKAVCRSQGTLTRPTPRNRLRVLRT
jgi:hypothetical protein